MVDKTPASEVEKEKRMLIYVYGPLGILLGLIGLLVAKNEFGFDLGFTLGLFLGAILSLIIYFLVAKNWKKRATKLPGMTLFQLILLLLTFLIGRIVLKNISQIFIFQPFVITFIFSIILFCSPLSILIAIKRKDVLEELYK